MRYYETLFIINPELSDEETEEVKEKFSGLLESSGATIVQIEDWGRRRLAYQVKKFHKGHYVLFEYGADPEAVTEMERNFKIDERVIRFLSVLKDLEFDPQVVAEAQAKKDAEEAKRAEKPEDSEDSTEAPDDASDDDDDDFDEYDDDDDADEKDSGREQEG